VSLFRPFLSHAIQRVSERAVLSCLPTHYSLPTSHYSLSCSTVHGSQVTSHKSRIFMGLPPLCRSQKSQLLCHQANPASFSKMPGWGGGIPIPSLDSRRESTKTPGAGDATTGHPGWVPLRFLCSDLGTYVALLPASQTRHSSLATRLPRALYAKGHFSFIFSGLPPLGFSCLSFLHSFSLFSTTSSLFLQNAGGGGAL
jgi:hypothetical protein